MFFEILKDYQNHYPNREEFDCKYKKRKAWLDDHWLNNV